MPSTSVRPKIRFARFVLQKNVASRRYLYAIRNPLNAKGKLREGFTQADVGLYERLVKANGGKTSLLFRSNADPTAKVHDVVFITGDPELARWVRSEIRARRLKAREDVTVAPLQCPWCDHVLPSSTPADAEKMYLHHLDAHPDKLEEGLGEAISVELPAPIPVTA